MWTLLIGLMGKMGIICGLIAYDCQNTNLNITTYSLTEIGKCKKPTEQIRVNTEKIQLLQIRDYEILPVYQCKIHVTRLISHCGMHSHMSMVVNGLATYLHPVSKNMCIEMHQRRSLNFFYGKHIDHLIANGTTYATVLMAGKMNNENSCEGGFYEDHKGSWSNVIVQGSIEITLHEQYVAANIQENTIVLPSGTRCPYKDKHCVDNMYGDTYWEHVDNFQCTNTKYTVIYEGLAKKLTPVNNTFNTYDSVIYSVDTTEAVFAMPVIRPTTICGQAAYETDHPKFFVIKTAETGTFYFKKTKLSHFNLDSTAYTNSKFVFLEKHFRGQLSALYAAVLAQKCELEQQVLKNLLTLATVAPTEFAYTKHGPGHAALTYGEVTHVIKCTPVEVTIRSTKECFHEVPVTFNNQTMFMAPRTQILQKYAKQLDCDSFLYPMYQFNQKWYKVSNGLHETVNPQILKPYNRYKWTYKSPMNLFKGGLYSQQDMETFQKHLILPAEQQAVHTILSRGMIGLATDMQGTNLNKLVDEATVKVWLAKSWNSLWTWFSTLGTVTAGLMGIYMIVKCVKFILDTIVHGTMLYELFGWSLHLIAALFDSLTMYCLHRQHQKLTKEKEKTPEDIEVATTEPPSSSKGLYPEINPEVDEKAWLRN